MTPISPAPKPAPRSPKKRSYSTIKPKSFSEKIKAIRKLQSSCAPLSKHNVKRKASEFQRCYHSKARVRFVKSEPCPVCQALGMRHLVESDNAHIVGGGAGRKAGYEKIVPLCRLHHRALHAAGSLSAFYVTFGGLVDLAAFAAQTHSRWLLYCGREGIDPQTGRAGFRGRRGA